MMKQKRDSAYQQILPVYQAIAKASVLIDGPKPSIEAGANLSFEPSMMSTAGAGMPSAETVKV